MYVFGETALYDVAESKEYFRGFGILPNKQNLFDKPYGADGQIYGKGTPFLYLLLLSRIIDNKTVLPMSKGRAVYLYPARE